MTPLTLTPDHVEDPDTLDALLARTRRPIAVDALDAWSASDLNALRHRLSFIDLQRDALVDGEEDTVDALIDHLVAALGARRPERPVMRVHRPDTWTRAELDLIRARMPLGETLFYVDEEDEPFDDGLLYDCYEDYLFPEQWD